MQIKFSHKYLKLWQQDKAELIHLRVIDREEIGKELLLYDTKYYLDEPEDEFDIYGYYPLPDQGKFIQIFLIGNLGIPFCTIRKFTDEKLKYYKANIGKVFDIVTEGQ